MANNDLNYVGSISNSGPNSIVVGRDIIFSPFDLHAKVKSIEDDRDAAYQLAEKHRLKLQSLQSEAQKLNQRPAYLIGAFFIFIAFIMSDLFLILFDENTRGFLSIIAIAVVAVSWKSLQLSLNSLNQRMQLSAQRYTKALIEFEDIDVKYNHLFNKLQSNNNDN